MQRLLRFVWPWSKSTEPTGPVVAVIEMSGVLQRPSQSRGRIPSASIHYEKAKKDVDRAFGLAKVQTVALDINCPGESHHARSLAHSAFILMRWQM
jgi:ClpP class serine protease